MEEKEQESKGSWDNVKIMHVNPVRRTVDVSIDGKPGPRRVRVNQGIDMGSSLAPKVHRGDFGKMIRTLNRRYFLTELAPKEATKGSSKGK